MKIGKKLIQKYLSEINIADEGKVKASYSSFYDTWKSSNKMYAELIENNDTFLSNLGCKLLEILQYSEMLKTSLVRTAVKEQHQELVIYDDKLKSKTENNRIYAISAKLPIIVKPKDYGIDKFGGYLLNDIKYQENLIIDNKVFKFKALYTENICKMANKISSTSYKINTALLDFIIDPANKKLNLLIDTSKQHEHANIKRTWAQDRAYKSYNSKVILQETILEIASFFRNFSEIYFPVSKR